MEPLISVIVPIYKIDKYLGICIESIINQTYKNLEIILVDDGSPDRCPEICDLYAKKDKRIKVVHKENGGLVSARKAGLQESAGEYIGYVDGDDWIGKGFYQSLISSALATKSEVVIAGFSRDLFDKSNHILNAIDSGVYEGEKLKRIWGRMISFGDFYKHGITTYVWNKLFKREVLFDKQMAVDNRITVGEDAAVTYPVLMNCNRICVTENCAYHYRQREDSMLKQAGNFHDEAARLKVLYEYLSNELEKYNLQSQIDDLILSTYIIRSGGILDSNMPELSDFPLSKDLLGKDIVLYGAGTFGQQLMKKIEADNICRVIAWVDSDYWEYRRCCMDVDPVDVVSQLNYDYVLVANLDSSYVEGIKKELLDLGVMERQIVALNVDSDLRKSALKEYLEYSSKETSKNE